MSYTDIEQLLNVAFLEIFLTPANPYTVFAPQ
jgi:hypothetical protein